MIVAAASRTIGRYRLRKKLFRDDTGTAYIACHTERRRNVIVKLIRIAVNLVSETWAEVQSRCLRETQAAGRLRHPNILSVLDAGGEDNYKRRAKMSTPAQEWRYDQGRFSDGEI